MSSKATIKLNIFFLLKDYVKYYQFSFQDEPQKIEKDDITINIPSSVFKYGKDKKCVNYKIYDENLVLLAERNMFVYYGENKSFLQTDYFGSINRGKTYEILLEQANLEIEISEKIKLKEYDDFGNKIRKRIVLMNASISSIKINKIEINLQKICYNNRQIKEEDDHSFQISEINLDRKEFVVKKIIDYPKINYKDLLNIKDIKDSLNSFSKRVEKLLEIKDLEQYEKDFALLKDEIGEKINYSDLVKYIKFKGYPKKYIIDQLKKEPQLDLEFFFQIILYINCMLKEIFESKQKFFEKIYLQAQKIKNDIDNTNFNIYQKICILTNYFDLTEYCTTNDDLDALNYRYFITSESEDDSILKKIQIFFNGFIEGLNENSKVFNYLLKIDSGCGYFNSDEVYTYDMQNINMLKFHLKDIFPEILFFFYLENDIIANTDSYNGSISINEFILLKDVNKNNLCYNKANKSENKYGHSNNIAMGDNIILDNIEMDNNDIDNITMDNIAMDIILYLFHEFGGHKKYLTYESLENSPRKFFDENGNIVELKPQKEFKKNSKLCEYILTSNEKNKGDSGHYLELAYGKIGDRLLLDVLKEIKNKSDLIKRPDLFNDDSGQTLKDYFIFKYLFENKIIKLEQNNENEIEKEILLLKNNQNREFLLNLIESNFILEERKRRPKTKRIGLRKRIRGRKRISKRNNKKNSEKKQLKDDKNNCNHKKISININKRNHLYKKEINEEKAYRILQNQFSKKYNIPIDAKFAYNLLKLFESKKMSRVEGENLFFVLNKSSRKVHKKID